MNRLHQIGYDDAEAMANVPDVVRRGEARHAAGARARGRWGDRLAGALFVATMLAAFVAAFLCGWAAVAAMAIGSALTVAVGRLGR